MSFGALVPWRRLEGSLRPWERNFDDLFSNTFSSFPSFFDTDEMARNWSPSVDIVENDKAIVVKADLPGLKKEDFDVSVKDGILTLSGERKSESTSKENGICRMERFSGKFTRSFQLPNTLNESKITASYTDGVLEVTVPKAETAKPRSIKVK